MNFGELFTLQVVTSGLSRRQLAKELGFDHPSQLYYYMKSKSLPKDEILTRICEYFGVTRDYYKEGEEKQSLSRPATSYEAAPARLPVLSDETAKAVKTGEVVLPHGVKICSGFVIVADERLEKLGFQRGSSLYISKRFDEASVELAIVQRGKERFFALCEQRGKSRFANPLDKEKAPVELGKKGAAIFASVEYILSEPNPDSFRR